MDPLTGLPNRRAFERALAREVERARRSGSGLAVALLDLDRFKGINDRYGHPAGDRALIQTARRIHDALRETDMVARYGGEEFAILLPGISAEEGSAEALRGVERARSMVARTPLVLGPGLPPLSLTLSGGVALYPRDARDGPGLVRAADQALYRAKEGGRDRVLSA
jgi:diguanylate cyclase (GGDEF)-like protein